MSKVVHIQPDWRSMLPAERMEYINIHVLGSNHPESRRGADVIKLADFRPESPGRCPGCGCLRREARCDCDPLGAAG